MNKLGFIVTSFLVALAFLSATFFVVDQRQFGVVFQLGEIKKVVTEPGLGCQAFCERSAIFWITW